MSVETSMEIIIENCTLLKTIIQTFIDLVGLSHVHWTYNPLLSLF